MGMTWKSLDLLRDNLGKVGSGVTAYLKNRQEDARREEQADLFKQAIANRKKPVDSSVAQLAFSGHNYNAAEALRSLAPKRETVGDSRSGYKGVEHDPYTGERTVDEKPFLEGNPEPRETISDQNEREYAELIRKQRLQMPLTPEEQYRFEILDEMNKQDLAKRSAGAVGVQGATQPGKTRAELEREERDAAAARSKAGAAAIGLGQSIDQTEELDLDYRLSHQPMLDERGQQIGWETRYGKHPGLNLPDPKKPPFSTSAERKAAQRRLEELRRNREETTRQMRVKQQEAQKPTSSNWQRHPSGFEYRIIDSPTA